MLVSIAFPIAANAQSPEGEPPAPAVPLITAITRQANLVGRVLWMDGSANIQKLSTREGISTVFDKCRKANINTVVVDVKPLSGEAMWPSKVAPRLTEWKGFQYPQDHDLLFQSMFEGRRRGIKVYASINVFAEAHKLLKKGPLYSNPDLQAIVYDVQRRITAENGESRALTPGENRGPGKDEIASYDATYPDPRKLAADETAVVVQGGSVTGFLDGALTDGGALSIPADGYVLIGKGEGSTWLQNHVAVGQSLTFSAKELLQPILEAPSEAVGGFVNPANPVSREYALKVVEELANSYALDGIVFDRMRYSSLRTDFSPLSKELFEKYLGQKVERFPQDIYEYDPTPGKPLIRGPHFKKWLEWRAKNITDWLDEATKLVQRVRPGVGLGVYVGSWYADYYRVGVNWAADDFSAGYDWMTDSYAATGYASKLNWISTGCYYPIATRDAARQLGTDEEETVEAAADISVRAVNDAAFVYAGLYLLDYRGKPEEFRKALQTALERSQGVMLFDLVYLEEYDWWTILNEAFPTPKRAPHDVAGLRQAIRQARKALPPAAAQSGTIATQEKTATGGAR